MCTVLARVPSVWSSQNLAYLIFSDGLKNQSQNYLAGHKPRSYLQQKAKSLLSTKQCLQKHMIVTEIMSAQNNICRVSGNGCWRTDSWFTFRTVSIQTEAYTVIFPPQTFFWSLIIAVTMLMVTKMHEGAKRRFQHPKSVSCNPEYVPWNQIHVVMTKTAHVSSLQADPFKSASMCYTISLNI